MSADVQTIIDMHKYMRPAGGVTEAAFIERYLKPLGFQADQFGNLHLRIGNPRILFSSHVDTVHKNDGMQKIRYKDGVLSTKNQNCLGADDTAGIWLMTEMIKAKVPGLYIIHYGEERGCLGSRELAKHPKYFEGIDIAIAFDRAGYSDVITHQMGMRTASDAFAQELADRLPGKYAPDSGGAYTDTNEYASIISECTNISVGYHGQHTSKEQQDVAFLIELRDALLKVDWDNIKAYRDPSVVEYDEEDWGYWPRGSFRNSRTCNYEELIRDFPEIAMQILEAYGCHEDEFEQEIEAHYGIRAAA